MDTLQIVYLFMMAAVFVSAGAGVIEAGNKHIDLFGVILVGIVSALGGGTTRDILLDRTVFWVNDPLYLLPAIIGAVATFLLARKLHIPSRWFVIPDALAMALFTIAATSLALELGHHWVIAAIMGVVTGVMGGVIRDVILNEVPLVFAGTFYATASALGALLFVLSQALALPIFASSLLCGSLIFALRSAALKWNWGLPKGIYR
ncbi:trimeric intracellular cation channel family protein [Salinibius halmophilus]|uniref:trimeric intracellular cation channel family protein n=1 Tax=Salinibius halmophilus TaxID=1853216 RepID=UPI000E6766CE|nr:TRIC cation channel family protein [Salinibius halmophilus]